MSISPRTVSSHVHNIMLKLGGNSRENIIDFVDESGKLQVIRRYYRCLLVQASFEKILIKIGLTINRSVLRYYIKDVALNSEEKFFLKQLQQHLKMTNIFLNKSEVGCKYTLRILNENITHTDDYQDIFLLFDYKLDASDYSDCEYIDFREEYYLNVLILLERIIDSQDIRQMIKDFTIKREIIHAGAEFSNSDEDVQGNNSNDNFFLQKVYNLFKVTTCSMIMFCTLVFLISLGMKNFLFLSTQKVIISDLALPERDIFLNRSAIIDSIDSKFTHEKGIQVVVLLGIGGSGKTTMARRYAKRMMFPIIWEINAENLDSFHSSMKELAYTFVDSIEDLEIVNHIYNIEDTLEHETRLKNFLTKKISGYSNWLMIFDNVTSFHKIAKHFPHDSTLWGNGKIIITTRDDNIEYNNYIPRKNIIRMTELNDQEKYNLFCNIIDHNCVEHDDQEKDSLYSFLDQIPPFPLDVSTAAHYVKAMGMQYSQYLKYMKEQSKDFVYSQKNMLKDIGEYTKTRYDIIALSLEELLDKPSYFSDLLLLINLVGSRDIPKELLVKYKDIIMVDNFIREQKKFSLLSKSEIDSQNGKKLGFSVHPSIQSIALSHLTKKLCLDKNSRQLNEIINVIEKYTIDLLQTKDHVEIELLTHHIEAFLSHRNLLNDLNKAKLEYTLGLCYSTINKHIKASKALHSDYILYIRHCGEDSTEVARLVIELERSVS